MKTNESFPPYEQNEETEEKDIKRKREKERARDRQEILIKGAVGLGSENKRLRDTDVMRKLHNTDSRKAGRPAVIFDERALW